MKNRSREIKTKKLTCLINKQIIFKQRGESYNCKLSVDKGSGLYSVSLGGRVVCFAIEDAVKVYDNEMGHMVIQVK